MYSNIYVYFVSIYLYIYICTYTSNLYHLWFSIHNHHRYEHALSIFKPFFVADKNRWLNPIIILQNNATPLPSEQSGHRREAQRWSSRGRSASAWDLKEELWWFFSGVFLWCPRFIYSSNENPRWNPDVFSRIHRIYMELHGYILKCWGMMMSMKKNKVFLRTRLQVKVPTGFFAQALWSAWQAAGAPRLSDQIGVFPCVIGGVSSQIGGIPFIDNIYQCLNPLTKWVLGFLSVVMIVWVSYNLIAASSTKTKGYKRYS